MKQKVDEIDTLPFSRFSEVEAQEQIPIVSSLYSQRMMPAPENLMTLIDSQIKKVTTVSNILEIPVIYVPILLKLPLAHLPFSLIQASPRTWKY